MRSRKAPLSPGEDPTSLCNLLISLGWISRDVLSRAIDRKQDELIGQTLIEMKAITQEQLAEALHQQKVARKQIPLRQAVLESLDRQNELQDKLIAGLNSLTRQFSAASQEHTGKISPIKRSIG
jgi:hypothetical protein